MGWIIDIVVLALLLISLIIGIVRGVGKSILKLISILGAFVLTWRLTPLVMNFVLGDDFWCSLVFGDGFSFKKMFEGSHIVELANNSDFFKAILAPLKAYVENANAAGSLEQYIPYLLAAFFATVLCSLLVYLVVRLLIMIIMAIIKAIFFKYKPGGISRFFGALFGLVNGAFIVVWAFLLASSFTANTTLENGVADLSNSSISMKFLSSFIPNTYSSIYLEDSTLSKAIEEADKAIAAATQPESPEPEAQA